MRISAWMVSVACLLLTVFRDFTCRPTLEVLESLVETRPGFDVTFACRVSGSPAPQVSWVLQNREVVDATNNPNSDQFFIHEGPVEGQSSSGENDRWSNLTIRRVTDQNAGEYLCVASNEGGVSEANASLYVLLVPVTDFRDRYAEISPGAFLGIIAAITTALLIMTGPIVFVFRSLHRRHKRQNGRGSSRVDGNLDSSMDAV